MTKSRIHLFDTTLRDGNQTPGVDFSLEDKQAIAKLLDEFGIDYVEGGYPGANPTDTEFFSKKQTNSARFTAFGMTKRTGDFRLERSGPCRHHPVESRLRSALSPRAGITMCASRSAAPMRRISKTSPTRSKPSPPLARKC